MKKATGTSDKKDNSVQVALDKECIRIMQSGNKIKASDAFAQLYKRYKETIHYNVLRSVSMNHELAEDLTQEIFVKIFTKSELYDFSNAVSTWMFKITKNHVIDHKRKEKYELLSLDNLKSEFGSDNEVAEMAFQVEDKSHDNFQLLVRQERAEAVTRAINALKSDEAKMAVKLVCLDELTYEEAAEKMDLPIGTVKAIIFRSKDEMNKTIVTGTGFVYA
ncbi:MAG: RNA polymerase sigma factor [Bacteroidia bacterium]|nr:RNA polymerase sigma factor [Bacteroidia bacterium]